MPHPNVEERTETLKEYRDWFAEPMTQEEIRRYISWRRLQPGHFGGEVTNQEIADEVGMTDGWVSDVALGRINDSKRQNRVTISRLLAGMYPDGIPQLMPEPSRRVSPPELATSEAFGPGGRQMQYVTIDSPSLGLQGEYVERWAVDAVLEALAAATSELSRLREEAVSWKRRLEDLDEAAARHRKALTQVRGQLREMCEDLADLGYDPHE